MEPPSHEEQANHQQLEAQIARLEQEVSALQQEKLDLEMLLNMTTEHSDTVEEELHMRAEEALKKSERQLRMIVEATPAAIIITRVANGQIVYANAMAGDLLGLSTTDLLGKIATDFYDDPTDQDTLVKVLDQESEVNRHEILLNRIDGTPVWVEISLRSMEFDDNAAYLVALHNITERKRAFEASVRFVPIEFLDFFQKEVIADLQLGDHLSQEMNVMFSDVRSFTSISEKMAPQEHFKFVNHYLGTVSPAIRENRGFIVKYLGDGIMAVFPNTADDAVQAGIDKLAKVNEFNSARLEHDDDPIEIGIGVNTGHLMMGIVGEEGRMEGDAFSDDVNLAARVEGLTKLYSVSFIITDTTYDRLTDPGRYHIRFLDRVQVKGRSKSLGLYEVFDADSPEMRQLKLETLPEYEEAIRLYYAREFFQAQSLLFKVLQTNPADKVAWHHLVQTTQLLDQGVSEDWAGVTVWSQK
jgi:PAS domain S-box-containing protein